MANTCGIYKITNLVTNESYIGLSKHIEERFKQHKRSINYLNKQEKLYQAFREYGLENFSFDIIEECPEEELEKQEQYWIKFYNSFNQGYNMTYGGDNPPNNKAKRIEQYDLNGNKISDFDSAYDIQCQLGYSYQSILGVCHKKYNQAYGYYWCFEGDKDENIFPIYYWPHSKQVGQFTKDNILLNTYNSAAEAERATGVKGIARACREYRTRTAGGYKWRYL